MPARVSRQIRMITDHEAVPPRQIEAVTATEHALAFLLGYTWDHDRPDHGDGAAVSGLWGVVPRTGSATDLPVFVTYDRAESRPFAVHGVRYRQFYEAMEAALGY